MNAAGLMILMNLQLNKTRNFEIDTNLKIPS